MPLHLTAPVTFEPIFMERIWGGRRLESEFGKKLPLDKRIGESWEISDRPEGQSVVANGPLRGKTLHELWTEYRKEVFGESPNDADGSPRRPLPSRFPLLIKLLDAQEKLSLQVHPPVAASERLGGEPKTEFWYIAAAEPGAELYVGLRNSISAQEFKRAIDDGRAADHVHTVPVKPGDAMFLPSGRFHAIGGGNLIVEIQQNSDTTYRVFDWNRRDDSGQPRQLHLEQALSCIDFEDVQPQLVRPMGELLVRHALFEVQRWELDQPRQITAQGEFAIVCCLTGELECAHVTIGPGEFILVPACIADRRLKPQGERTSLLRVTIPR